MELHEQQRESLKSHAAWLVPMLAVFISMIPTVRYWYAVIYSEARSYVFFDLVFSVGTVLVIISSLFELFWYIVDEYGITRCTLFYRKSFSWSEIVDIYTTSHPLGNYSSKRIECVIVCTKWKRPPMSWLKTQSIRNKGWTMAIDLDSPENRAASGFAYIDRCKFMRMAEKYFNGRIFEYKPEWTR